MVSLCPKCSRANAPKAKFCLECGVSLVASGQETDAPVAQVGESVADASPSSAVCDQGAPRSDGPEGPETSCDTERVLQTTDNGRSTVIPAALESMPSHEHRDEIETAIEKEIEDLEGGAAELAVDDNDEVCRIVAEAELPLPISVAASFERVLIAGCSSYFSVRIDNLSGETITLVELWVESTAFTRSPRVRLARLGPGAAVERSIEIQVTEPGHPLLNCTLEFEIGPDRYSYTGNRSIRVLERPASLNTVSISVGDILSNRDGGVSDNERAVVSNLVDLSKIQTLNDLLNLEIPKKFESIRLYEDFKSRTIRSGESAATLSIIDASSSKADPGHVLELRPITGNPDSSITIVSRAVFRIGRSRTDTDFAAWFLPRSPENDARTRRLSRVHAVCEVSGSALWLKDAGSSNGSNYENKPLRTGVQLERRGLLELGGDFRLQAVYFPSAFSGLPPITNLSRWAMPDSGQHSSVRGAVRFEQPPDTLESAHVPWRTLWLLSDATFGNSHANPLPLTHGGLGDTQGRIYALHGCFLLENLIHGSGVVVDGCPLRPGELLPLRKGMRVMLGNSAYDLDIRS